MTKPKRSRRGRMLRAIELHRDGLSNRAIAKILECDEGTVRNDLKAASVVRNLPRKNVPQEGQNSAPDSAPAGVVSLSAERFARRQA